MGSMEMKEVPPAASAELGTSNARNAFTTNVIRKQGMGKNKLTTPCKISGKDSFFFFMVRTSDMVQFYHKLSMKYNEQNRFKTLKIHQAPRECAGLLQVFF
jgi:hypothetical protein